jgi:hypothetical protein
MSDEATIRARQSIRRAAIQTGGLLIGTALLTLAHRVFGWIDQETTTRALMALFGLFLMAMGNAMPKQIDGPAPATAQLAAVRQSVTRVGGWAMLLGGLVWTVLWTVAPRDLAEVGSVAAVAAAVLIMLVYAVWRYASHGRTSAN